jgi:hypothetical protein
MAGKPSPEIRERNKKIKEEFSNIIREDIYIPVRIVAQKLSKKYGLSESHVLSIIYQNT